MTAVGGWVGRRAGAPAEFDARFALEVDAFFVLALSAFVATRLGGWVLVIGVLRYVFVVARRVLPWLRAPLPPSTVRRIVAAAQGIVLTVAAADLLPRPVAVVLTALALVALAGSFGR